MCQLENVVSTSKLASMLLISGKFTGALFWPELCDDKLMYDDAVKSPSGLQMITTWLNTGVACSPAKLGPRSTIGRGDQTPVVISQSLLPMALLRMLGGPNCKPPSSDPYEGSWTGSLNGINLNLFEALTSWYLSDMTSTVRKTIE